MDRIPKDFTPELSSDPKTYQFVVDSIKDGTEPTLDNFDELLPYNGGLIVVFQPYQVHSGASGIVRTYVPKNAIPKVLCLQ